LVKVAASIASLITRGVQVPLLQRLKVVSNPEVEIEPEIGEIIPQDPVPHERPVPSGRKPAARRVAAVRPPSSSKLAKEVSEDLTTLFQMTAAAWSLTDQCCAPTLDQQAPDIAKAITNILARNPRLLAKFAQADTAVIVVQAAALGRALLPVGRAVYANHVAKSDGEASDGAGPSLDQFPPYDGRPRS
jgi:hypothetical protein